MGVGDGRGGEGLTAPDWVTVAQCKCFANKGFFRRDETGYTSPCSWPSQMARDETLLNVFAGHEGTGIGRIVLVPV